ncbi:cysteine hydrolase family protein [Variovorax paradoxus]|uniref:cysteine hydrolase family protein n=1 Tax=Variovorax paradoxus TaxID=34073 RepID=UPI001ABBE86D
MTDRALLVIDMQKGMQEPRAGRRNNPDAEAKVQRLLAHWRTTGRPVVHVRHMSRFADSVFFPGQPGAAFQDALAPLPAEHVVEKNVTDAFAHTGLERWLRVRGIAEIVVVGVATNMSVEATARTASCLGFAVTVVSDASFAFDRAGIDGATFGAEQVHAMALANLQGEYAQVVTAASLLG